MSLQAEIGMLAVAVLCHGTILTCAVWALWGDASARDVEIGDLVDRLTSAERRLASLEWDREGPADDDV